MVVDVDAAMAENRKPFQWLGCWVCMGLNSAVAFLGRFHPVELGCFLFCLSSFVRTLHFIGLEFRPILVFKARSQDGNCCLVPVVKWKMTSGLLRQLVVDVSANKQTH